MPNTVKDVLNRGNINTLANAAKEVKLGTALGLAPAFVKGAVASNILVLPEEAKAIAGILAYVTAGSVTGVMTYVAGTPATTQFTVNKDGNIQFFGTDAVTSAEVTYVPIEGDIVEEEVVVVSNVGALGGNRTSRMLLSAIVTAGTALGAKTTAARGATPSAGSACTNLLGTGITFAGADAVTRAVVRYIAAPKVTVKAGLIATSDLL